MKPLKPFLLLALSVVVFTMMACNNDDDTDTPDLAKVSFTFDYTVDGQNFAYGQVYDINGTSVKFDLAQFYVGGIIFRTMEGQNVEMTDKYLLVKPDGKPYEVGELDPEHYHEIVYSVGVLPGENNQTESDFTNRDADDPLAIQNPPMHWNWNSGYRFIRVDGLTDTDGDGTPETVMEFHIGTDQMLETLTFVAHKDMEAGDNTVGFEFDLAQMFEGIDLSTNYATHTGDDKDLADQFLANLQNALTAK